MLIREEWALRGYRPGRYDPSEEVNDTAQIVRLANVEIYARRASAGLPIFREIQEPPAVGGGKSGS